MSFSYFIMIIIVLIVLFVLFFKRRECDFVFIYVFVLLLYSLPTLFRIVYNPNLNLFTTPVDGMYVATSIVFLSVLPFLYLSGKSKVEVVGGAFFKDYVFVYIVMFFSFLGFFYNLPLILNSSSKVEVMEVQSNILISTAFSTLPLIGFVSAFKLRLRTAYTIFFFLTLIVLLLGSRRSFTLILIALAVLALEGRRILLIRHFKLLFLSILGLFFIVVSKTLYGAIISDGFNGVSVWFNNFNSKYFLTGSEFLTNTAILNEIIYRDFSIEGVSLLKSFLAIQPIPLSYFSFSSSYFNDAFQQQLFYGVNYGMAYSPWGEAYSWAGYFGVFVYSFFIPLFLHFLWIFYKKSNSSTWGVIIFIMGIMVAFWVHRNSLGSILAYLRNIFYPAILLLFFATVYSNFKSHVAKRLS